MRPHSRLTRQTNSVCCVSMTYGEGSSPPPTGNMMARSSLTWRRTSCRPAPTSSGFPTSLTSHCRPASSTSRLSEPAAIRESTHPADWQNSGLITVHPRGTPAGLRNFPLAWVAQDCDCTLRQGSVFAQSGRRPMGAQSDCSAKRMRTVKQLPSRISPFAQPFFA